MKTFKVGDRVRVKDECVGKEYRYPKDGGNGTIIGRESVELDWRVHLDKQRDRNDWWSYRESELILLEDEMEYTVNGVTYRQLKDITIKALILAGADDNYVEHFDLSHDITEPILIKYAIDYALHSSYDFQKLVDQGFVEVVEKVLKPCPFCGGEAYWDIMPEKWVVCKICGAETRLCQSKDEAIEVWNKRV